MDLEPLHKTIPARAEEIGPLRHEVQRYAERLGVVDPHGLALALSETVANAVVHAYVGEPVPGEIEIHAEPHDGRGVRLVVADHGRGMAPRPDSPGVGLGLPLVAAFAERFEVSDTPGGGTIISMEFPADGGERAS